TYEAEIARLGGDFRSVFEQRAREENLIKSLDLDFSGKVVEGAETTSSSSSATDNPDKEQNQ
ncbi:hypothetical protein ACP3V7_25095, partial [Salmonella enterica]